MIYTVFDIAFQQYLKKKIKFWNTTKTNNKKCGHAKIQASLVKNLQVGRTPPATPNPKYIN